jgi:hypothetical protein
LRQTIPWRTTRSLGLRASQPLGHENDIEIYHVNFVYEGGASKILFDGLRFSDNKYVLGQVDLSTKQVSVTSTIAAKWSDFQTFG